MSISTGPAGQELKVGSFRVVNDVPANGTQGSGSEGVTVENTTGTDRTIHQVVISSRVQDVSNFTSGETFYGTVDPQLNLGATSNKATGNDYVDDSRVIARMNNNFYIQAFNDAAPQESVTGDVGDMTKVFLDDPNVTIEWREGVTLFANQNYTALADVPDQDTTALVSDFLVYYTE